MLGNPSKGPFPIGDLGFVYAVFVGIVAAGDLHAAQFFLDVRARDVKARNPVDHVDGQAEAVDLVAYR